MRKGTQEIPKLYKEPKFLTQEFSHIEPQKLPLSAEVKEDSSYASIIYSSIDNGNIEMLKDNLILDAINQDLGSGTALGYAINSLKIEAIETLINCGARSDIKAGPSTTYFHQIAKLAINKEFSDTLLIKMFNSISKSEESLREIFLASTDQKGFSPLDYIFLYGRQELAKYFIFKLDISTSLLKNLKESYIKKAEKLQMYMESLVDLENNPIPKKPIEDFINDIKSSVITLANIQVELLGHSEPELADQSLVDN